MSIGKKFYYHSVVTVNDSRNRNINYPNLILAKINAKVEVAPAKRRRTNDESAPPLPPQVQPLADLFSKLQENPNFNLISTRPESFLIDPTNNIELSVHIPTAIQWIKERTNAIYTRMLKICAMLNEPARKKRWVTLYNTVSATPPDFITKLFAGAKAIITAAKRVATREEAAEKAAEEAAEKAEAAQLRANRDAALVAESVAKREKMDAERAQRAIRRAVIAQILEDANNDVQMYTQLVPGIVAPEIDQASMVNAAEKDITFELDRVSSPEFIAQRRRLLEMSARRRPPPFAPAPASRLRKTRKAKKARRKNTRRK